MIVAALLIIAQNWQQPKMPINRKMDKQAVVYSYNRNCLEKKWINSDTYNNLN